MCSQSILGAATAAFGAPASPAAAGRAAAVRATRANRRAMFETFFMAGEVLDCPGLRARLAPVSDEASETGDVPFAADSPWTGEPRRLLERAIERHGGWDAWRGFGGVSFVPVALTGLVPRMKGVGQTFRLASRM